VTPENVEIQNSSTIP